MAPAAACSRCVPAKDQPQLHKQREAHHHKHAVPVVDPYATCLLLKAACTTPSCSSLPAPTSLPFLQTTNIIAFAPVPELVTVPALVTTPTTAPLTTGTDTTLPTEAGTTGGTGRRLQQASTGTGLGLSVCMPGRGSRTPA